jgi:hypothetical protein
MVETTIDIDAAENHEYMIKAEFDEQLEGTIVHYFNLIYTL